jgi:hypothetical protein
LSELRRSFVPIWLIDRYQIEAAAKTLGGVYFPYGLNREGQQARTASGQAQWAALYALMDTLSPAELTVPAHLQPLLSSGFGGNPDRQEIIEIIPTAGGPVFDPLKATEVGATQTLNALLAPARLNRLEAQHAADASVPSPSQVTELLLSRALSGAGGEVGRRIATTSILALARAQRDASLSPSLALELSGRLARLADQLDQARASNWSKGMAALLKDREALDKALEPTRLPKVPPGMPIGMDEAL